MIQLSEHFTLDEFVASDTAARRGIDNTPPPAVIDNLRQTAKLLEQIRALIGGPIIITSGFRSPALNHAVGGVADSAHTRGHAADFIAPRFGTPQAVCTAITGSPITYDQLIHEYGSWTHIAWAPMQRMQALTIDRQGTRDGIWSCRP